VPGSIPRDIEDIRKLQDEIDALRDANNAYENEIDKQRNDIERAEKKRLTQSDVLKKAIAESKRQADILGKQSAEIRLLLKQCQEQQLSKTTGQDDLLKKHENDRQEWLKRESELKMRLNEVQLIKGTKEKEYIDGTLRSEKLIKDLTEQVRNLKEKEGKDMRRSSSRVSILEDRLKASNAANDSLRKIITELKTEMASVRAENQSRLERAIEQEDAIKKLEDDMQLKLSDKSISESLMKSIQDRENLLNQERQKFEQERSREYQSISVANANAEQLGIEYATRLSEIDERERLNREEKKQLDTARSKLENEKKENLENASMILTEKMALEDRIQTFEDLEKGLVPREEAIEIAMKRVEEQRVLNLEQATELVELKQKIEEDDAKVKKERAELVREKKKFEKDKEDLNIIAETNASRSEEFKQLGDILTRRERVLSKKEQEVIAKEKQHGDIDDIIVATKKEAKRAEEVERLNKQISTELTNYVLKLDEVVERERQLDSQVKALNAQVIDLVSENSKLTKK
jgi:hypothetical protein